MSLLEKLLKKKEEEEKIKNKQNFENLTKEIYDVIKSNILTENVIYNDYDNTISISFSDNSFKSVIYDVILLLKKDNIIPNNVTYKIHSNNCSVTFGIFDD